MLHAVILAGLCMCQQGPALGRTCGEACLYVLLRAKGLDCQLKAGVTANGEERKQLTSLAELSKLAQAHGLEAAAYHTTWEQLKTFTLPLIAHLQTRNAEFEQDHFILVIGMGPDWIDVLDPPSGPQRISRSRFCGLWTGHVLATPLPGWQLVSWPYLSVLAAVALLGLLVARHSAAKQTAPPARWRGFSLLLLAGCLLGAILAWAGPALSLGREPRCQISRPDVDLGPVAAGIARVEVGIRNTGGGVLDITSIKSSCTCTKIIEKPGQVGSGEEQNLIFEVDTSSPQRNSATLTLATNDPHQEHHVNVNWHTLRSPVRSQDFMEVRTKRGETYTGQLLLWYPGGLEVPRPLFEGFDSASSAVKVVPGEYQNRALTFTSHGMITHVVGQQTLAVSCQPTPEGRPLAVQGRIRLSYRGMPLVLPLAIRIDFRAKDIQLERTVALFTSTPPAILVGQTCVLNFLDERPGGKLELRGIPEWLEAKVVRDAQQRGQLQFKLLQRPPGEFVRQAVQISRPDDPEATVPITVLVYGGKE